MSGSTFDSTEHLYPRLNKQQSGDIRINAATRSSAESMQYYDEGLENAREHIESKFSGGVTYGARGWASRSKWSTINQKPALMNTTKIIKINRSDSHDSPEYGKNMLSIKNAMSVTNMFSVRK